MNDITLVKNAIHNPADPRHFMEYKFPDKTYTAAINGQKIAETSAPLILCEVGFSIYDPVVYFPIADVDMALLSRTDKTSHCPLKGDTSYFDFVGDDTKQAVADVAWQYTDAFDFADKLKGYVSFDQRLVQITN